MKAFIFCLLNLLICQFVIGETMNSFFRLSPRDNCAEQVLQTLDWYSGTNNLFSKTKFNKETSLQSISDELKDKHFTTNIFKFDSITEVVSEFDFEKKEAFAAILHCSRKNKEHYIFVGKSYSDSDFVWVIDDYEIFYGPLTDFVKNPNYSFSGYSIVLNSGENTISLFELGDIENKLNNIEVSNNLSLSIVDSVVGEDKPQYKYSNDICIAFNSDVDAFIERVDGACSCFKYYLGSRFVTKRGFSLGSFRFEDSVDVGSKTTGVAVTTSKSKVPDVFMMKIEPPHLEDIKIRFVRMISSGAGDKVSIGLFIPEKLIGESVKDLKGTIEAEGSRYSLSIEAIAENDPDLFTATSFLIIDPMDVKKLLSGCILSVSLNGIENFYQTKISQGIWEHRNVGVISK